MDKDYVNIKIDELVELKDEAIENGLRIRSELIEQINSLYHDKRENYDNNEESSIAEINTHADTLIIELKNDIKRQEEKGKRIKRYNNIFIPFLGVSLLTLLIVFLNQLSFNDAFAFPSLSESLVAGSLGIIGAVVYILFNQLGVINEIENDAIKTVDNISRLSLGAMVGWVFYYIFSDDITNKVILLMLPFLSGFSTKLVVGILNQALQALEMTLGIKKDKKLSPEES